MNYRQYIGSLANLNEAKISDEDIKKAKEAAIEQGKATFGKDFDEKKANTIIDGLIEKHKDKVPDGKALGAILMNGFR